MGVIYKITNTVNGKCYVGKTMCGEVKRFREHKWNCNNGTKSYLYNSMRKYGIANFSMEVIDHAQTEAELDAKEIEWIAKLQAADPRFGYNCTPGGEGALHGPSSRARLKGVIKRSPEVIAALKARIISDETRALQSKVAREREARFTPEQRSAKARHAASVSAEKLRGVPRTLEVRMKISVAHKGKKIPLDRILKQAASLRGRKQPADEIARRVATSKKIWADPEKRKAHGDSIRGRKHSPETIERMKIAAAARLAKYGPSRKAKA